MSVCPFPCSTPWLLLSTPPRRPQQTIYPSLEAPLCLNKKSTASFFPFLCKTGFLYSGLSISQQPLHQLWHQTVFYSGLSMALWSARIHCWVWFNQISVKTPLTLCCLCRRSTDSLQHILIQIPLNKYLDYSNGIWIEFSLYSVHSNTWKPIKIMF